MPNKKNQPTNLEKKREKIYVIETQIIFIFFFFSLRSFRKKKLNLQWGLIFIAAISPPKACYNFFQ